MAWVPGLPTDLASPKPSTDRIRNRGLDAEQGKNKPPLVLFCSILATAQVLSSKQVEIPSHVGSLILYVMGCLSNLEPI